MADPRMPGVRRGGLLRREVSDGIKWHILDNGLRPGDLLPTEAELGSALGASRSSVREAVKTLEALDMVEVRHGHGTYVGRLGLSALVESLTFRGLVCPEDDFRAMSDLVDVRELFERGMADRIVASLDSARLDALEELVAEMEYGGTGYGGGFIESDRAFHALLVEPLGNRLIGQLSLAFRDVQAAVAPYYEAITAQDEAETVNAHREIVRAARAGDVPGFVRAVGEHYAPLRRWAAGARLQSRPGR